MLKINRIFLVSILLIIFTLSAVNAADNNITEESSLLEVESQGNIVDESSLLEVESQGNIVDESSQSKIEIIGKS